METAIERKRRLRRERILQNSESRIRRILGEPTANDSVDRSVADNPVVDNPVDAEQQIVVGPVYDGHSATIDSNGIDEPSASRAEFATNDAKTVVEEQEFDTVKLAANGEDGVNGIHHHLLTDAKSMDAAAFTSKGEDALRNGVFGFDASKLQNSHQKETTKNMGVARDAIAVDDEEELRRAGNLLLRDSRQRISRESCQIPKSDKKQSSETSQEVLPPLRTRKLNSTKRSQREENVRNELERMMRQEPNGQKPTKTSSRAVGSVRRKPPSLWYTKTWFRTSFAVLLGLFVRVLIQINLSDYFSDSAFYPFFSMELSFFVAAFCSKPPGYRIPIGGGIVEMITNMAGFSREILGNLKWLYEFSIQKPIEEFCLYFFVFSCSHLLLNHVEGRNVGTHDEL